MRGIRSAINRHLQNPPHNKALDIIRDPYKQFMSSNHVFDGYLKMNKEEGGDTTTHKAPITDGDWKKLHNSDTMATNTPTTLQNKVFVNMLTHFGKRGREGLRILKKDSFEKGVDDCGRQFYRMRCNEVTKNHQTSSGKSKDIQKDKRIMAEQKGDPLCPVASMDKYLSKLKGDSDILFPYPLDHIMFKKQAGLVQNWEKEETWYSNRPIGKGPLGDRIRKITKQANLSQHHTNHCVRATVVTRLTKMGVDPLKIIEVTGHSNPSSLKPYIGKSSIAEQAEMSNLLHSSDSTDLLRKRKLVEAPSASSNECEPAKKMKVATVTSSSVYNETPSNEDTPHEVLHHDLQVENMPPQPVSPAHGPIINTPIAPTLGNPMQHLNSMFAGAHFMNATINIQWQR